MTVVSRELKEAELAHAIATEKHWDLMELELQKDLELARGMRASCKQMVNRLRKEIEEGTHAGSSDG